MEIGNSYTIVFTGYKSKFSKKLEKALDKPIITRKEAKNLLKDFTDMYYKKVSQETKIGSGFYGTVYKIDDCYVLKRGNERLAPEFKGIKLIKNGKFSHLKNYFGEAIAKIYNKIGEDMFILKNVYSKGKSIPVGVPVEFAQNHTKEECLKYYAENYLPKFAKLPQRSFDNIAKDFAILNSMCKKNRSYFFDFLNPNNFVLCGKTIRILDDINQYERATRNCVTDLFEVFINKMYLDCDAVFDEKLVSLRKILAKKLILAGAKHNIPMCYKNPDLSSWNKTFGDLLNMHNLNTPKMISDINKIINANKNQKKRTELIKQYLEQVVGL